MYVVSSRIFKPEYRISLRSFYLISGLKYFDKLMASWSYTLSCTRTAQLGRPSRNDGRQTFSSDSSIEAAILINQSIDYRPHIMAALITNNTTAETTATIKSKIQELINKCIKMITSWFDILMMTF